MDKINEYEYKNESENEDIELNENTQTKVKKHMSTAMVIDIIVILGVLGMVCLAMAFIMVDTGITRGGSLDSAKLNFYYKQNAWTKPAIIADVANGKTQGIEKYFENSNLIGLTHVQMIDNNKDVTKNYGQTDSDDTITYITHSYSSTYGSFDEFHLHILRDAPFSDQYTFHNNLIEFIYENKINIWIVGILIGVLILKLYFYLIKIAGYKKGEEGIVKWGICHIPIEVNFLVAMFLGAFLCAFSYNAFTAAYRPSYNTDYFYFIVHLFLIAMAEVVFLSLSVDISMRVKTKTLGKTSILCNCLKGCKIAVGGAGKGYKKVLNNIDFLWKYILIYIGMVVLSFMISATFNDSAILFLFGFMLFNAILFPFVMYLILGFNVLFKASEKISKGDYDYKITNKYMLSDISLGFKGFSENLNNISAGMEIALQEKIKSELLKTELITNVSHDIKTPLTSIINYSDLICKEDCDNEKIIEYSEVLYRQSNKLKKLIDDLIDASKASSGNISVDMQEIKLSVFIEQIIGEYEEKLMDKNLELIQNSKVSDISISADGRLLSRVFDNIFNNILKYSLENTRVYLDIDISNNEENSGDIVVITLKNTSKYQLNISEDLLTERFIRGDLSRNSEGSGLGLSIAQNLIKSQGGDFDITIDGDLFKVIIKIKIY